MIITHTITKGNLLGVDLDITVYYDNGGVEIKSVVAHGWKNQGGIQRHNGNMIDLTELLHSMDILDTIVDKVDWNELAYQEKMNTND